MKKSAAYSVAAVLIAAAMVWAEQVPSIPATAPGESKKPTPADSGPQQPQPQPAPKPANATVADTEGGKVRVIAIPAKQGKKVKRNKATLTVEKDAEGEPVTRDELVDSLRSQINTLEDRYAVASYVNDSLQRPATAASVESKTIYTYVPDAIYMVYGAVNHLVDVQLQPGEKLTGSPAAGDTTRWVLATSTSGTEPNSVTHVLIKPIQAGIETNFLVTTDRHAYRLFARSSKNFFVPTVAWAYPQEEMVKEKVIQAKQEEIVSPPTPPEKLNFGYAIKPDDDYPWTPLRVFDDGSKTYIHMPPNMENSEAPALFIKAGKDLNLVNYRLKGDYFVIDRLIEEGELRSGPKDIVKIKRARPWAWNETTTK